MTIETRDGVGAGSATQVSALEEAIQSRSAQTSPLVPQNTLIMLSNSTSGSPASSMASVWQVLAVRVLPSPMTVNQRPPAA